MTIAPVEPVAHATCWESAVVTKPDADGWSVLATGTDRLRIAVGVNDIVIRHLFSISLSLHTTRTMVPDAARDRLDATIDDLDATIRDLRSLIFDLEGEAPRPAVRDTDPIE